MRFQIWVQVRDLAIFEKVRCGCSRVWRLKKLLKIFLFIYIFTIKIFLKNTLLCLDSQNKERRKQETHKKKIHTHTKEAKNIQNKIEEG